MVAARHEPERRLRNIGAMREATLTRGRLSEHPVWSAILRRGDLAARMILPVIVSGAVEDREKVDGASWLQRPALPQVVREARHTAPFGIARPPGLRVSAPKDQNTKL